ncbi:MAG: hypothetical protein Tsb005_05840 [Gammaproteobacteria bacterium]
MMLWATIVLLSLLLVASLVWGVLCFKQVRARRQLEFNLSKFIDELPAISEEFTQRIATQLEQQLHYSDELKVTHAKAISEKYQLLFRQIGEALQQHDFAQLQASSHTVYELIELMIQLDVQKSEYFKHEFTHEFAKAADRVAKAHTMLHAVLSADEALAPDAKTIVAAVTEFDVTKDNDESEMQESLADIQAHTERIVKQIRHEKKNMRLAMELLNLVFMEYAVIIGINVKRNIEYEFADIARMVAEKANLEIRN